VYKLVYKELLAYIVMYMIINITYRTVLVPKSECDASLASCVRWKKHRELFETFRLYTNQNLRSIPLTFVLGFYVSLIINRWWRQYQLLPWPDSFGMLLRGLYKVENNDKGRMIRRNMIRYITLSYCIALRTVSFRLKKRFPSLEHLVHAGIMRLDEYREFQKLDEKVVANKWFLPLVWTAKMIADGLESGAVHAPTATCLMDEVTGIRAKLTGILTYDWIAVPLVYTQVVTLGVYFYFIAALFGSQWVMPATEEAHSMIYKTTARLDLFYPFFVTLQFIFYIGWLKVAETLINPFGEDDDDFELNRLIDRHVQVGFLIVDPLVETPDLLKDKYWDDIIPQEMLYTVGSIAEQEGEFQGSAEITLNVNEEDKIYSEEAFVPNLRRRRLNSNDTIYESIRSRTFSTKKRLSTYFNKKDWRRSRSQEDGPSASHSRSHKPRMSLSRLPSIPDSTLERLASLPDSSSTQLSDAEMRETYTVV